MTLVKYFWAAGSMTLGSGLSGLFSIHSNTTNATEPYITFLDDQIDIGAHTFSIGAGVASQVTIKGAVAGVDPEIVLSADKVNILATDLQHNNNPVGDVAGPGSSTADEVPTFSGTTGKIIQGGSGIRATPTTAGFYGTSPVVRPDRVLPSVALTQLGLVTNSKSAGTFFSSDVETFSRRALKNELVLVDPSAADVTITAPANPEKDDHWGIKIVGTGNAVFAATDGEIIEHVLPFTTLSTTVPILGAGAEVHWAFDGSEWLVVSASKIGAYTETWQAVTPHVIDGSNVEFAHVPTAIAPSPVLVSHATGTFGIQQNMTMRIELECQWEFISTGNNAETEVTVGDVNILTGTSTALIPTLISSFQSSRAGSFRQSGGTEGLMSAVQFDTFAVQTTEHFATQMTTSIDEMILILGLS